MTDEALLNLHMRQSVFYYEDAAGNPHGEGGGGEKKLVTAEMLGFEDGMEWPGPREQARFNRDQAAHAFRRRTDGGRWVGDRGKKYLDKMAPYHPDELKVAAQTYFDDVLDPIYEQIKVEIAALQDE